MILNYAIYCSGNATRVINYYEKYSINDFSPEVIVYDGGNPLTQEKLKNIFGEKKLISYLHNQTISKKKQSDLFSLFLLKKFKSKKIDYVFCFGLKILKPLLINSYKNKIINFHPSLLPKYPGLNAIDQAILNNEKEIGNTAHFIDEGIDTGEIILQASINISNYIDYNSVLSLQLDMLNHIWNTIELSEIEKSKIIDD
jgi:phosphoribosylglycinamide formyltransferase 1